MMVSIDLANGSAQAFAFQRMPLLDVPPIGLSRSPLPVDESVYTNLRQTVNRVPAPGRRRVCPGGRTGCPTDAISGVDLFAESPSVATSGM